MQIYRMMFTEGSNTNISLEQSYIMRGMAIIAIALHNFCHTLPNVVGENEFWFSEDNVSGILAISGFSFKTFCDIFSFFGWYGVPVFIFLSGYGLVKKYESSSHSGKLTIPFSKKIFILSNLRKLFLLMLPGTILFILWETALSFMSHKILISNIFKYAFTQTLLSNFTFPFLNPEPGVYWYFGLAAQLYILYALLFKRCRSGIMWGCVLLCIAMQCLVIENGWLRCIGWLRHNSPGWLLVFATGIWYGRKIHLSGRLKICMIIISLLIFIPSTLNRFSWQISLIAAVAIFIGLAFISNKIPVWRNIWIWVGRLSPFIFASHPVIRLPLRAICKHLPEYTPLIFATYVVLLPFMALFYRWLWRRINQMLPSRFSDIPFITKFKPNK